MLFQQLCVNNGSSQVLALGEKTSIISDSFIGGLTVAACSIHLKAYSWKLSMVFFLMLASKDNFDVILKYLNKISSQTIPCVQLENS